MAAADLTASAAPDQRLPSTKPIDSRWDRSRSIIFRSAEQNILRDFRWTHADPITFCETPASRRGYARREIPRRSDSSQVQDSKGGGDIMENPGGISISSGDKVEQLKEQLKQMEAESAAHQQALKKIRALENNLSEAQRNIKQLEDSASRDKKEMERRATNRKTEIATERKKAKQEMRDESREEREAFDRMKAEQEAALEERGVMLSQREANFDAMEAEAREKARVHALRDAEAAYAVRYDELEKRRRDIEQGQAKLEENEALLGFRVAAAEEAARKEVKAEAQQLLASALQNEEMAKAHLREAIQLQNIAARTERDAVDGRMRQSQTHDDMLEHMKLTLERISDGARAAVAKESNAAIAEFQMKRENAEYREQVERASYDNYREVWTGLAGSSDSLIGTQWAVVNQLRRTAMAWMEATRFNASKIHPSFPAKYPDLSAQIKRFLDSAYERAEDAANHAELSANNVVRDMLRGLISRGHYSRMLTRFHRFSKAQGNAEMARVLTLVFGEPLILSFQREMERKRTDVENQLKGRNGEAHTEELQAEIDEIDQALNTVNALLSFLSSLGKYEVLKSLREDSVFEKELQFATQRLSEQITAAKKPWRQFVEFHPNTVPGSEIDKDVQSKDRGEMRQLVSNMQNDYISYHKSVWERSILKQQLGEGGEHIAKINAHIDREARDAHSMAQSKLERLAGQRLSRPRAFQAASSSRRVLTVSGRRSAGSGRVRAAFRTPQVGDRTSTAPVEQKSSSRPLDGHVAELTLKLKSHSNYNNDKERQYDMDELERLKLEQTRRRLEKLRSTKSSLEKDSKPSTERLRGIEMEINALEKKLAREAPASESMKGSPRSSTEVRKHAKRSLVRKERRAGRLAASKTAHSTSRSAPDSTHASASTASNKSEGSSAPSLKFTPTTPQQAWRPLWLHVCQPFYGNDIKSRGALKGSNAAMMSNILTLSGQDTVFEPKALQVYSLHSLHTTGIHEQLRSETEDFLDLPSTSILPTGRSFDDTVGSTQSSTETVSDPESDYEPSDSEMSAEDSELAELLPRALDLDPLSSPMSTQEFVDALESQSPMPPGLTDEATDQVDPNLSYNISPEDYRRAAMASTSTNAAFWSYKLYKNPEGKTPSIHYCTNLEAAEAQAKQFLNEPVLGFDLEWEMGAAPGKSSIKDCVSLVQIASESKIGLFQLALFKGDAAEHLMPPSLRQILESREIAKTGVNVSGDAGRIEKCFGFQVRGLFELSHLYNVVTWSEKSPHRVNKKLLNLADQVQNVLLLPLKKDKVRTSQWSKRLRFEQTEYAASDAYAGFRLYHALEARRKKMNPTPPRPAFWEEKKPLVLGDGTAVVPRRIVKKKVGDDGKIMEDEDEEEEYFDALETLDPYQLDPAQTAGVPLGGLSISYPTLPTLEDDPEQPAQQTEDEKARGTVDEPMTTDASSEPAKEDPRPRPTTLSSPAVTQANSWAQTFRNGLPATHNLRNKQAHLRAYHLWHYQSHDCKTVATLLRDPPLSLTTVASYVLQAVSEGKDLDFDKERFNEVLELLPPSVRGRYWWVVERLERAELEREVGRGYG